MREITHYGILGMKWGKRKSSGSKSTSLKSRVEKRQIEESEDYKKAKKIRRKKVSEMSNQELQDLTRRMQLEKSYRDLNPTKVKKGKNIVGGFLGSIVKDMLKSAAKEAIGLGIENAVDKDIVKNKLAKDLLKASVKRKKR